MHEVSLNLNDRTGSVPLFSTAQSLLDQYYAAYPVEDDSEYGLLYDTYHTINELFDIIGLKSGPEERLFYANYIYCLKGSVYAVTELCRICEIIVSSFEYSYNLKEDNSLTASTIWTNEEEPWIITAPVSLGGSTTVKTKVCSIWEDLLQCQINANLSVGTTTSTLTEKPSWATTTSSSTTNLTIKGYKVTVSGDTTTTITYIQNGDNSTKTKTTSVVTETDPGISSPVTDFSSWTKVDDESAQTVSTSASATFIRTISVYRKDLITATSTHQKYRKYTVIETTTTYTDSSISSSVTTSYTYVDIETTVTTVTGSSAFSDSDLTSDVIFKTYTSETNASYKTTVTDTIYLSDTTDDDGLYRYITIRKLHHNYELYGYDITYKSSSDDEGTTTTSYTLVDLQTYDDITWTIGKDVSFYKIKGYKYIDNPSKLVDSGEGNISLVSDTTDGVDISKYSDLFNIEETRESNNDIKINISVNVDALADSELPYDSKGATIKNGTFSCSESITSSTSTSVSGSDVSSATVNDLLSNRMIYADARKFEIVLGEVTCLDVTRFKIVFTELIRELLLVTSSKKNGGTDENISVSIEILNYKLESSINIKIAHTNRFISNTIPNSYVLNQKTIWEKDS